MHIDFFCYILLTLQFQILGCAVIFAKIVKKYSYHE